MTRKAIPKAKTPRDWLRLRPPQVPDRDHVYFENAGALRFEPGAPAFTWDFAWWLAELSLLAYVHEASDVERQLSKAGFESPRCFGHGRRPSTEWIAAERGGALWVAFRGTEARERADWATDLDARFARFDGGGRVHAGFLRALEHGGAWTELERHISAAGAGKPLLFTGHSLGGALATLAAARSPAARVVTFGAPKVGDLDFARLVAPRSWRVVNGRDVVPRLPPISRYVHAGEAHAVPSWRPLGPLLDHMPVLYAISVWNEAVAPRA